MKKLAGTLALGLLLTTSGLSEGAVIGVRGINVDPPPLSTEIDSEAQRDMGAGLCDNESLPQDILPRFCRVWGNDFLAVVGLELEFFLDGIPVPVSDLEVHTVSDFPTLEAVTATVFRLLGPPQFGDPACDFDEAVCPALELFISDFEGQPTVALRDVFAQQVPEPAVGLLLLAGAAVWGHRRRRKAA